MATWEDGPEYAPLERPDAFDAPSVSSSDLEPQPAPPAEPLAPLARPVFADPPQPVPQLGDLVPAPPAQRDPSEPFDVVSSLVTAESSAWAAAHWSQPQSPPPPQPSAPQLPNQQLPAEQLSTGQFPTEQFPTEQFPSGQFPTEQFPSGQFPAPGTPQWFVPGPGYQQQPPVRPVAPNARTVLAAVTPAVVISLVIGGLIWTLAPITIVLAALLAGRMTHGRQPSRVAFTIVLALLGTVGLMALLSSDDLFSSWWNALAGWACFSSWAMLVTVIIAAYQALKRGRPDPPPANRRQLR